MDQLLAEKRLAVIYLLSVVAGALSSITTGIAWSHWYRTLDQCVGRNCSCILYGQHNPNIFLGGGQSPCIWTTFAPLIYVFLCLCLTCFHGYRVLFTRLSPRTRTSRTMLAKMEPGESVQIHAVSQESISILPTSFWICCSVFSAIFTLYALIHFAIFTDGFYTTCREYRKTLEKLLHGSTLPVINNRLSCQGVFDFMDYMQMDSGNAYRNGIINTGLDLTIGLVAACIPWILLLFATIINIQLARSND